MKKLRQEAIKKTENKDKVGDNKNTKGKGKTKSKQSSSGSGLGSIPPLPAGKGCTYEILAGFCFEPTSFDSERNTFKSYKDVTPKGINTGYLDDKDVGIYTFFTDFPEEAIRRTNVTMQIGGGKTISVPRLELFNEVVEGAGDRAKGWTEIYVVSYSSTEATAPFVADGLNIPAPDGKRIKPFKLKIIDIKVRCPDEPEPKPEPEPEEARPEKPPKDDCKPKTIRISENLTLPLDVKSPDKEGNCPKGYIKCNCGGEKSEEPGKPQGKLLLYGLVYSKFEESSTGGSPSAISSSGVTIVETQYSNLKELEDRWTFTFEQSYSFVFNPGEGSESVNRSDTAGTGRNGIGETVFQRYPGQVNEKGQPGGGRSPSWKSDKNQYSPGIAVYIFNNEQDAEKELGSGLTRTRSSSTPGSSNTTTERWELLGEVEEKPKLLVYGCTYWNSKFFPLTINSKAYYEFTEETTFSDFILEKNTRKVKFEQKYSETNISISGDSSSLSNSAGSGRNTIPEYLDLLYPSRRETDTVKAFKIPIEERYNATNQGYIADGNLEPPEKDKADLAKLGVVFIEPEATDKKNSQIRLLFLTFKNEQEVAEFFPEGLEKKTIYGRFPGSKLPGNEAEHIERWELLGGEVEGGYCCFKCCDIAKIVHAKLIGGKTEESE